MAKHVLSDKAVKAAKGAHQSGKKYYADGGGLYLKITTTGSKSWVYRWWDKSEAKPGERGKLREMGLGAYPTNTLSQARNMAEAALKITDSGGDPIKARDTVEAEKQSAVLQKVGQAARGVWTFDMAAKEFIDTRIEREARNDKHIQQWRRTIEQHVNPHIGHLPLDDIELKHALQVLNPIWYDITDTAKRVRQRCERILDWGRIMGHRTTGDNPFRWKGFLDNVLPSPNKIKVVKHMPSMLRADVPAFLNRLRAKPGMGARALEFLILCASRSGEVRGASWDEINLDKKLWTIPGPRMKSGKEHKVPLSLAAVAILEALPQDNEIVFPGIRGGAMSDMTLSKVMRDMKIKGAVVHGFRSSFKDWAREITQFPDEISELALAHSGSDAVRAAYARSDLLELRRELMTAWAAFCNPPPSDEKVVPIEKAKKKVS